MRLRDRAGIGVIHRDSERHLQIWKGGCRLLHKVEWMTSWYAAITVSNGTCSPLLDSVPNCASSPFLPLLLPNYYYHHHHSLNSVAVSLAVAAVVVVVVAMDLFEMVAQSSESWNSVGDMPMTKIDQSGSVMMPVDGT